MKPNYDDMPRSKSIGNQEDDDIFVVPEAVKSALLAEDDIEEHFHPKFLVVPSFVAGCCLGTNNFFLGFISKLGIAAAFEFSLGAMIVTLTVKLVLAIKAKKEKGVFFPVETSNFVYEDKVTGGVKIKWMNVLGIVVRPSCNMSF